MILHVPHSSTAIPEIMTRDLLISNSRLQQEIVLMTDHYCDDLYQYPGANHLVFPWSRLFCDVERFEDDTVEAMSEFGHGMFYTKTFSGDPLRVDTHEGRQEAIRLYRKHHRELTDLVDEELSCMGFSMVVDCHSFSKRVIRYHPDSTIFPDICIGTDEFHTPLCLANSLVSCAQDLGYSVSINYPFSGSMVPLKHYKKDKRVVSVMIEINRSLYLDNDTEVKSIRYGETKGLCTAILRCIRDQLDVNPCKMHETTIL